MIRDKHVVSLESLASSGHFARVLLGIAMSVHAAPALFAADNSTPPSPEAASPQEATSRMVKISVAVRSESGAVENLHDLRIWQPAGNEDPVRVGPNGVRLKLPVNEAVRITLISPLFRCTVDFDSKKNNSAEMLFRVSRRAGGADCVIESAPIPP